MSSGRLKASTNRVRTSVALQSTSIWTNAIGMEQQVNRNEEIERQINAPTFGGGGGRAARRAAAAEAVEATGGFDSSVSSYSGLLDLARSQGAISGQNRGACKKCGQLGHLTKQCRNQFSRFFDGGAGPSGGSFPATGAAAAAGGLPGTSAAAGAAGLLPVLESDGPELSSDMSSLTDSSSESSSDSEDERRRRKDRKRKRHEKKAKLEKKRKKAKKEKSRKKKSHKDKKRKRESSSDSSGSD